MRIVPLGLAWLFGLVFLAEVLFRYEALSSNVFDLGLFLTNFENVWPEWQRSTFGHLQPLMPLWGLGYQVMPPNVAPLVLVGLQAMALLGSAIWVSRVFGAWSGVAMLLYYPFWANALLDFHFDHLVVPLLAAFFVACERKRFVLAAIAAASLVLVKEPFALQAVACGLYFFWMAWRLGKDVLTRRLLTLGTLLIFWGGFWFCGATHWLLLYFGDGNRGAIDGPVFSWLGSGLTEMTWSIVSRPDQVLWEIISTPNKLKYLAVIFGLLAFIPLLRPAALIVALPLLMIAMLAKGQPLYYSYANHYTAGVIVPAIVAFHDGLPVAMRNFYRVVEWIGRHIMPAPVRSVPTTNRRPPLVLMTWMQRTFQRVMENKEKAFLVVLMAWLVGGHVMFASSPISRLFWSDKVWSYNWRAYVPIEREAMMKTAMLKYIPADPEVSVTAQNTVNWYHLAHRKVYAPFPQGIEEPIQVMDWSSRTWDGFWSFVRTGEMPPAVTHDRYADYVVLDLKRPWFIVDKGCEWIYGECRDKEKAQEFLDLVARTKVRYEALFERDGFMILRRR